MLITPSVEVGWAASGSEGSTVQAAANRECRQSFAIYARVRTVVVQIVAHARAH